MAEEHEVNRPDRYPLVETPDATSRVGQLHPRSSITDLRWKS
jgi:hypothetical protein